MRQHCLNLLWASFPMRRLLYYRRYRYISEEDTEETITDRQIGVISNDVCRSGANIPKLISHHMAVKGYKHGGKLPNR
jgi:hypothetical protein